MNAGAFNSCQLENDIASTHTCTCSHTHTHNNNNNSKATTITTTTILKRRILAVVCPLLDEVLKVKQLSISLSPSS